MTTKHKIQPPELEFDVFTGFMRYLEHGFPSPLVRWHYHEAYELHLIVETGGKLFVGDYVGEFGPGNLVITGPRLPHNWISTDYPAEGVAIRDMVVQFNAGPLLLAAKEIPEIREVLPLLERARYGIEFTGISDQAKGHFARIRDTTGMERFMELLRLLSLFNQCNEYRLLSSAQIQSFDDDESLDKINTIVNYVTENYSKELCSEELAASIGMSQSKFSRFFRRSTGNCFTEFVNRIRINRACQMLMNTNHPVTNICYDVGFNNVANFNRRFLELKQVTPKEFRRMAEGRFGLPQ